MRDPGNLSFLAVLAVALLLIVGVGSRLRSGSGALTDRISLRRSLISAREEGPQALAARPDPWRLDAQALPGDARLPTDFDPGAYAAYHPELGLANASAAAAHYLAEGRGAGRLAHRLRLVLRYTACTGLINQHYSHVAALSLASALGAEVVLPPAVCRDSFAHYFSVFKEKNEVRWSPVPLSSLLDVPALTEYWAARGLHIHATPALTPFPDLTQPGVAFPLYDQPGVDPALVTR